MASSLLVSFDEIPIEAGKNGIELERNFTKLLIDSRAGSSNIDKIESNIMKNMAFACLLSEVIPTLQAQSGCLKNENLKLHLQETPSTS